MSNLDRIYELNLDLIYKVQNDEMEFSVNDINTSMFYVTFTRNRKEVLNLRGKSVVYYIVKPNGNVTYTNLQYDLDQERFYCDLSSGLKNLLGNYIGQIVVYDSETEERIVIPTHISYTVVSDILETSIGDVDEEEQMTILEGLIKDISSWSGKIDEAVNKANESLNIVEGVRQIALTNQDNISSTKADVEELENEISQIKKNYTTRQYVDDAIKEIDVTGQLGDYATKDYVDKAIDSVDVTEQLKDYVKSEDIPTKVSQLENDKGYLTEHQSLEGYATESYVTTEIAKAKLEGEDIDLSGYALKKDVPNKLSQLINDSGFLTNIPSEYVTESELNTAIESVDVTEQLEDYAKKTEIPTKVSQLTNDKNYLTSIPSEYVTETELDSSLGELEKIETSATEPTDSSVSIWINTSEDTPTNALARINDSTMASNTTWSSEKIYKEIVDIQTGGDIDLSGYALKSELPTKISQLINDSNFLTSIPSEYVTETELNNKGYITSIPSEYVTETELNNKGYLTQHQDLSAYAKKTELPTKTSQLTNDSNFLTNIPSEYVTDSELTAKGYATESYVDDAIADVDVTEQLGDYAKKTDIPTKVSQLTNDKNYLTSVPSEYVTDSELNAKGYLTQHQDLSAYAKKTEIPTVTNDLTNALKSNYDSAYTHSTSTHAPSNAQKNSDITKAEIEAKLTGTITTHTHNYLTSVPSEYVTESELTAKDYATESYVDSKVSELSKEITDLKTKLVDGNGVAY